LGTAGGCGHVPRVLGGAAIAFACGGRRV
jgi:hypothetical protein